MTSFALMAVAQCKPNIILIMADDLGYGSLGCYGNTEMKTPNIDRLAASGMRFTDFHSNGALCTPTRAALMTGRYQQRCVKVADEELSPIFRAQRKANPVQRWAWGLSPKEITLPHLLKQAGYRSALIGKWHLGYDIQFHPINVGFDEFRGFIGGNVDCHTHVAGYGLKQLDWWKDKQIENEAGYTTDLLTRYATEFIGQNKDKPFFLYLAHAAPHEPWQGRDPNKKKSAAASYREMIEVLDESVGSIIAAVHKNQLEKNTLLIFSSDNGAAPPPGVAANAPLQGRKGSLFEGGHRVPMIASWPDVIAAGSTNQQPAMTMDFLPTLVKLAGAAIPSGHDIDGIDLMPHLKDNTKAVKRTLHWLHGDVWAIRQGEEKLIGKGKNAQALFHLNNDIGERHNLLKEKPDQAERLRKQHQQWLETISEK